LGNLTDCTLHTETVVKLHPDVLLLPIGNKTAADEVKLEEMLGGNDFTETIAGRPPGEIDGKGQAERCRHGGEDQKLAP
ncbi:hypothetical protein ACC809_37715, partial [Rhizobium johnstonii]